jgi:iron-sulfur cluster assembly protein
MQTVDVPTSPASEASPTGPAPAAEGAPATSELKITLTPKAVAMAKQALEKRSTPHAALRLGVKGGGCSGFAYVIEFSDTRRTRDVVFNFDGLDVVVDPKSLVLLNGSTLDYEVKLMQRGFKFVNPQEKTGCGCGESFGV